MKSRKARWVSLKRVWTGPTLFFGWGIGWDAKTPDACLYLCIGRWMLAIGPHYPADHKEASLDE